MLDIFGGVMEISAMQIYELFMKINLKELINIILSGFSGVFLLLKILRNKRKAMAAGELSSKMKVSSARMAAMLNNLSQKGYIKKEKTEDDGRKTIVTITKDGQNALAKREGKVVGLIDKLIKKLSSKDIKNLLEICKKLARPQKQV